MSEDKLLKSLEELHEDLQVLEELSKGPNYWKDKDPAKYKKMLNKLKRERKTPGSKERGYQQVLQAKRRENGGSGTTSGQNGKSGHSSGKMSSKTGSAAKRYASAEKKHGRKMSMDRKDNNKGYGSGNVRLAPQELNRGDENNKNKKKYYSKSKKKLNKAIPDANAHKYSISDKNDYTDKDAIKARNNALKHFISKENKPWMTRKNNATGKDELHVLIHRGIKGKPEKSQSRKGGHIFGISDDNKFDQESYAVHTTDHNAAKNYGDVHSFWVPISSVSSMSNYLANRRKNPNFPDPDWKGNDDEVWNEKGARDSARQSIADLQIRLKEIKENNTDSGESFLSDKQKKQTVSDLEWGLEQNKKRLNITQDELDEQWRKEYGEDLQGEDESHIVVRPGKFDMATSDEINELDSRIKTGEKMLSPKIKHAFYDNEKK